MRSLKFWIVTFIILTILGIASIVGIRAWRAHVIQQQDAQLKTAIRERIEAGDLETAWLALQRVPATVQDPEWQRIRRETIVKRRDTRNLLAAFESTPDLILDDEQASLLLARTLAHQRDSERFETIRAYWRNRPHTTNAWETLEIDQSLLARNIEAAWKRINPSDPKAELSVDQLIQRGTIKGVTNAVAALEDLDRAFAKNPQSPEVRSFRAQLLEHLGDQRLAQVEYTAAHLADPNNPLWRDQLADFFQRHQKFDFALRTWAPGRTDTTPDFIWLKSAFWSHVAVHYDFPENYELPSEPLAPLAKLILELPPNQFWDEVSFQALANQEYYRRTRQEVYWLSILQKLLDDNERAALEELGRRPFRQGLWDIYLHETLSAVLRFRETDQFSIEGSTTYNQLSIGPNQHSFIAQVKDFQRTEQLTGQSAKLSIELGQLLKGPNAFSAVLLSSGWRQAALKLFKPDGDSQLDSYPSWFHYGIAQLKRSEESSELALEYLEKRPHSEDLVLLAGELQLSLGQNDAALESFSSIANTEGPEGSRAAWLLTLAKLKQEDYKEAKNIIATNVNLRSSMQGQELLAKTAQLMGDENLAKQIYTTLTTNSTPAMRFLADEAFRSGDFQTARKYTLTLVQDNPTDLRLMGNLRAIDAAILETE